MSRVNCKMLHALDGRISFQNIEREGIIKIYGYMITIFLLFDHR